MHRRHFTFAATLLLGAASALTGPTAQAAEAQIQVTRQYGLPYIPLMVMEHQQLFEKHLKRLGVGDAQVNWATMSTTTGPVDRLLSGTRAFASPAHTGPADRAAPDRGPRPDGYPTHGHGHAGAVPPVP